MASDRWRWLIWAVPLGLVTLTFALSWHFDPDFWRSPASLMRLAQEAALRGDQPRALELARKAVSREPGNADYSLSLAQICLEAGQRKAPGPHPPAPSPGAGIPGP